MTPRVVTCAVMLRAGKALLTRRAPGQKNAGLWEFPGGKTEPGESDRACLEREIWEELGVRGQAGEHLCDSLYTYNEYGMQILLRAYLFTPEGEDFDLRVHDRAAYFDAGQMEALPLSPADRPIAQRVRTLLERQVNL